MTPEEHQQARATIAQYDAWAKQYQQRNGWTVIPSDAVPPVKVGNALRSAVEVFEFKRDRPEKYFMYITRFHRAHTSGGKHDFSMGRATTFTGDKLGDVSFGRTWRSAFGDTRVSVTIRAINGETYAGTYYASSGDYARVKRVQRKPRGVPRAVTLLDA